MPRRKRTYQGFGDFALRGVDEMREDIETVAVEYHKGLHREGVRLMESMTPVDEGRLKRGWGSIVGRSSSVNRPGKGLDRLKPGDKSRIVNTTFYAHIIDAGRSAANPHGSPRAPRGMVKPALGALEARKNKIRAKAIAIAERGL